MPGLPSSGSMAQSSQDFVRALKAATDPPVSGGLNKIEIARQAWDDASFYVPNKGEVIADWILTKFLKEKSPDPSSSPSAEPQYWSLLLDVIVSPEATSSASKSRTVKTWLINLLNRIPIAPIVISLLKLLPVIGTHEKSQLSPALCSCLAVIWPLGAQKLATEVLLECFGTFVVMVGECEIDESLARLGISLASSYSTSLGNSPNKKKLYTSFLQSYFQRWLEFVDLESGPISSTGLRQTVLDAGVKTIFSLEVLRQYQDSKLDQALFDNLRKLIASSQATTQQGLPLIFASYIQNIRKNRTALYGQGSTQAPGAVSHELNHAGMRFFAASQLLLDECDDSKQTWETRVALLTLVHQENICKNLQDDTEHGIRHSLELALGVLAATSKIDLVEVTDCAVECLSVVAKIDYDFILPVIPRVLPRLLLTHASTKSTSTLLNLLLDYHTKTRTMDVHIESIFASLSIQHLASYPGNIPDLYQVSCSSPLMHVQHLDSLAKAINTFLTPGQTSTLLGSIKDSLNTVWDQFYTTEKESNTIREDVAMEGLTPDLLAISFYLTARMAAAVLCSLPMQSVSVAQREELHQVLVDLRSSFIHHALTRTMKMCRKKEAGDSWASQCMAASLLRLQYALDVSSKLRLPVYHNSKTSTKMADMLDDPDLLPELYLEIFRSLLITYSSNEPAKIQVILDPMLDYLDRNLKTSAVSWAGQTHNLVAGKRGRRQGALALMHMVFDRWLPIIETFASDTQLERLIRLLLAPELSTNSSQTDGIQGHTLLMQTLRSASFWELRKTRVALMSYLLDATSEVDGMKFNDPTAITSNFDMQCDRIVGAFRTLLYFPVEYLSKSCRGELFKRAMTADVLVALSSTQPSASESSDSLTILRTFLKRVCICLGGLEQPIGEVSQYLDHLMGLDSFLSSASLECTSATLDLAELYLREVFKLSEKNETLPALLVLGSYSRISLSQPNFRWQSFSRMVEVLIKESQLSSFPEEVVAAMKDTYYTLSASISPEISQITVDGISVAEAAHQGNLLSSWYCLLSFGTWLRLTGKDVPLHGDKICVQLANAPEAVRGLDELKVTTFALLLQELHHCPGDSRLAHFDLVVAAYIAFWPNLHTKCSKRMDEHLCRASKTIPPEDFSYVLDLISTFFSSGRAPVERLATSIHLSVTILQEHPQSTLKYIQTFVTQSINTFSGHDVFTAGPLPLRIQTLEFLAKHCSDRPAALRILDLGGIWSILSKFLCQSTVHDESTSPQIFRVIVNIISTLIRLRRDLVTLTLPHLGMVLRQLMMCIRRCRPNLGPKQTTLVTNTLPRWINAKEPLGTEECKALARLLETLTAKTVARNNASSADIQKSESLAKPFSKHAAYVLKAYIEAMNDPLCILLPEVRKEVQPGLFALCSMINDHSRDAMMVSAFDAGGKATMKALWKEYAKQRYVGKG